MTNQVIPEAAVEAAAKALWEPNEHGDEWAGELDGYKDYLRDYATKALEAAAPHMLAGVTALANEWEKRGESDMAYSKTVADDDVAIQLLQAGAQMVDDARLVRNAIGASGQNILAEVWEAGWKASSDWSIYIEMGGDEPETDNPYTGTQ